MMMCGKPVFAIGALSRGLIILFTLGDTWARLPQAFVPSIGDRSKRTFAEFGGNGGPPHCKLSAFLARTSEFVIASPSLREKCLFGEITFGQSDLFPTVPAITTASQESLI